MVHALRRKDVCAAILAALLIVAVMLTACGDPPTPPPSPATVTFAAWNATAEVFRKATRAAEAVIYTTPIPSN